MAQAVNWKKNIPRRQDHVQRYGSVKIHNWFEKYEKFGIEQRYGLKEQ